MGSEEAGPHCHWTSAPGWASARAVRHRAVTEQEGAGALLFSGPRHGRQRLTLTCPLLCCSLSSPPSLDRCCARGFLDLLSPPLALLSRLRDERPGPKPSGLLVQL